MANWGNTQIKHDNVKIVEHERVAETNPEVYKLRGDEFASRGLLDEAEKEYLTAIKLRENSVATTRDEAYSYYRYHRDLYKMYYKSERKDFEKKADSTFYKSYYFDARTYKKYEKTLVEVGSFKDIKGMWHEFNADLNEDAPITVLLIGLVIYSVLMIAISAYLYWLIGLIIAIPIALLSLPREVFKASIRGKGISQYSIMLVYLPWIIWIILFVWQVG